MTLFNLCYSDNVKMTNQTLSVGQIDRLDKIG